MAQHKNIGGSGTQWIAAAIFTKIKARLDALPTPQNLNVQEYDATITSGTQFTQQLAHYSTLKLLEVYVNGLRCQSSEYSVSAAGLFSLTNTLTGSGNTIKIVEWYT